MPQKDKKGGDQKIELFGQNHEISDEIVGKHIWEWLKIFRAITKGNKHLFYILDYYYKIWLVDGNLYAGFLK